MSHLAHLRGKAETLKYNNATGSAQTVGELILANSKVVRLDTGGVGTTGPNTTLANGSNGTVTVMGRVKAPKVSGSGDAVVTGQPAYWDVANEVFTPLPGGAKVYPAGYFAEAATEAAATCEVVLVQNNLFGGLLYTNLADSSEVENTTDETDFDESTTIDGSKLEVGDVIEVIGSFKVIDNNSTDTLTIKLYCGTEVIVSTGAVDAADGDVGYIHAFITVRAKGASGALQAHGVHALGVPGTVTAKPFFKEQASEDLSGDVAVKFSGQWSVEHADNEVQLEGINVILHRKGAA